MTIRAVVAGGGIAGTVCAIALHEVGVEVEVYEAYDHDSEGVGAFLTVAVNGLAALEPLGLAAVVARLGMATPAMELHSGRTGRSLGGAQMAARTVTRSDLYLALREEAARRGIGVHYGRRLVGLAETGSTVTARFPDGSSATVDLLVGADGLHSPTPRLIDPRAPRPAYLGLLNTGGFARGVQLPGEPGVAHFLFGRRCFFGWFLHPDAGPEGEVWWFANPPSRAEPAPDAPLEAGDAWRARLEQLFAGDHGPMPELIAATEEIFAPWGTYDLRRVPRWHTGHAVLIGDAAHAMSPSAGQGASMAIEDAVTLARCVRDAPAVPDALQLYTRERRARVEKVVTQGRRNGTGKAAGPLAAMLRDATLPFVLRRFATPQAQSWLFDHRIDFAARVTG